MKKIFLSLVIVLLNAEVIDKIIATINNIPITSYDLEKTEKKLNLPKDKALNYLLDQKLIDYEIKKLGIDVDDFELDNAMEKIAKQNGLSLFEFKNILLERGQFDAFKKQLKDNLLKQKLFDQIVQTKLKITPDEIKNYYNNHKNEFQIFNTIQVTKYSANNRQLLLNIKQNPLSNTNVKTQTVVYDSKNLPLGLLFLFKQTKVGDFTPIINDGISYVMFYVANKEGKTYMPFDKAKNIIANKLISQKREMILKEYFSKLKNRADIKFFN